MAHFACHREDINAAVHAARLKSSLSTCLRRGGARYCRKHTAIKMRVPFLQYGHAKDVGAGQGIFSVVSKTGCGIAELVSSSDDFNSLSRRRLEGAKIP